MMPAAPLRTPEPAMPADPRLIAALDVPTVAEARALTERIGDAVSFYKVGLQLLASDGAAFAKALRREGHGVFCDWKLHDIGATVEKAAAAIAASVACDLLTVHGMTPDEYREKWGLPADYPMVAPNYSATRSRLAKDNGLGRKAGGK